jgi:nucleotide-binding universal stress UspA family protein
MVPALDKFLHEEAQKILPKEFTGTVTFDVAKGFNPEDEAINFLKRVNASLIVVATRGKHGFKGLFLSSFTDYMVKFAPCDVFVVRPSESARELRKSA